jgi:hypothetical protein
LTYQPAGLKRSVEEWVSCRFGMTIGTKRSGFAAQQARASTANAESIHPPLHIGVRIAAFCRKVTQLCAPGKPEVRNGTAALLELPQKLPNMRASRRMQIETKYWGGDV